MKIKIKAPRKPRNPYAMDARCRKAGFHKDKRPAMPTEVPTDLIHIADCINQKLHLTKCDDDGYCSFCGEQF